MLQTLDNRLGQARDGKLGHLEFLELLLEDEISRRQSRSLQARIKRAHFDEVKTLAEYDFNFNPKIPAGQIRDLATCRYLERTESVIICGPVGLGKSHVAQALGWEACARGYSVLFTKTSHMLQDLGAGHLNGSWQQRLRYLKKLVDSFPIPGCDNGPTGLALGPNQKFLGACDNGAASVEVRHGQPHKFLPGVAGADEIWFNPGDHNFYLGIGGPPAKLGVIDANDDHVVTVINGKGGHSVAAYAGNNHIFDPDRNGIGIDVFQSSH